MKLRFLILFINTVFFINGLLAQQYTSAPIQWEVGFDKVFISDANTTITLKAVSDGSIKEIKSLFTHLLVNGESLELKWDGFTATTKYLVSDKDKSITVEIGDETFDKPINPIPLWLSVIPPLIAILLALVFREVITSLFIGILSGALMIGYYTEGVSGLFTGFLHVVDKYIMGALNDWSHLAVIFFSMTIGAVVSIISKNGGMRGVVNKLEPYAHNPRSGQYVIWLMGILIFFDDYANTLVVGNTMRPVADRLNISREKLAYLVDSTAAPVAAIAFITTWIGAELGYIQSGIVDIPQITETPYTIFLNSLAYSFYPLFTLAFMLILINNRRDFGPMVKAELNARENKEIYNPDETDKENIISEFEMKKGIIPKAYNAVIPILVIIFGVIWGMYYTGVNATDWNQENLSLSSFRKLSLIIGNADSFMALLWASASGAIVAIIMTISQKIMNLGDTINAGITGYKTMLPAMLILILAWSLAIITEEMHTAVFLNNLWSDSLSPFLIPAIVFILSALVSFSTGSSWGTMAILYPLLLPASYHISIEAGLSHNEVMIIFYNVVSVILAGSVFGDHCSPISDTTILSSLASSCNHIDHVRTQLPYALTTGFIAIVVGTIPASMGVSPLILFPIGIAALYATVRIFGKKTI
jgi:Na+/H+ antiporter NhaC